MQSEKMKGEITVFLALLFSVFSGLVLTVIESARIQVIRVQSEQVMQGSIHSVFGEYNQDLLSLYGLFAIDGSFRGAQGSIENVREHLSEYAEENFLSSDAEQQRSDWLKLHAREMKIKQFQLLSDKEGAVLTDQAVRYERERGQLPNRSDIVHAVHQMQTDDGSSFLSMFSEYLSHAGDVEDNPAEDVFETAVNADLLDLTLGEGHPSGSMGRDCASRRSLQQGTYAGKTDAAEDGDYIFDAYLLEKFGNYVHPKDHAVMLCEQEYLIAGKGSEGDCLRECAKRILSQREGQTFSGFTGNEEILRETEELAEQLCENGGDPYYTQMSLICAWAYAESVIEVSRLLYGGYVGMDGYEFPTVPLAELENFTQYCHACGGSGESYDEYLAGVLAQRNTRQKAMRCMDLIEENLRHAGHPGFAVDTCVTYFKAKMDVTSDYGHGCEIEREYGYFLNL